MRPALAACVLLSACSSYEVTVAGAPPAPPLPEVPGSVDVSSVLQPLLGASLVHDFGGESALLALSLGAGRGLELEAQPTGVRLLRLDATGAASTLPALPALTEAEALPCAAPGRFAFHRVAGATAWVLEEAVWREVLLPREVTLDAETRLSVFSSRAAALRTSDAVALFDGTTWTTLALPGTATGVLGPWSSDGQVRVVYSPAVGRLCTQSFFPSGRGAGDEACGDLDFASFGPSANNGFASDFQIPVRTASNDEGVHFKDGVFTRGGALVHVFDQPGLTRLAFTGGTWSVDERALDLNTDTVVEGGREVAVLHPHFFLPGRGREGSFASFTSRHGWVVWVSERQGRRFIEVDAVAAPYAPAQFAGVKWPTRCNSSPLAECTDGTPGCNFACPLLDERGCLPGDAGVQCLAWVRDVEPLAGRGVRVTGRLGSVLGEARVRFEALDGGVATDLRAPQGFFSYDLSFESGWNVTFEVPDAGGRVEPVTVPLVASPPGGPDLTYQYVYLSQGRRVSPPSEATSPLVEDALPIPGANVVLLRHANLWRILRAGAGPHDVESVGEFVASSQRPVVMPDARTVLFPGASANTSVLVDVVSGVTLGALPGLLDTNALIASRARPCAYFGAGGVSNVWCWTGGTLQAFSPNIAMGSTRVNIGRYTFTPDGTAYVLYDETLLQFERRGLTTAVRETLPNPTYSNQYAPLPTVAAAGGELVVYRAQRAAQRNEQRLEAVWKSGATWNSQVVADGVLGEASPVVTSLTQPVAGWLALENGTWQVMRFDGRTGLREVVAAAPGGTPDFVALPPRVSGDWLIWGSASGVLTWNVLSATVSTWPLGTEVRLAPNGELAVAPPCAPSSTCSVTRMQGSTTTMVSLERGADALSLLGDLDVAVAVKDVAGAPSAVSLQRCGATCRVDATAELVMQDSRPPFTPIAVIPAPIHSTLLGGWGAPCVLYTRDLAVPSTSAALRAVMCAR